MIPQPLRLVVLPLLLFLCLAVSAQTARRSRGLPDTRVMFIDATTVDSLTTLMARDDIDAVALDVTRAELERRPGAAQAILLWVARGGVVYVHSDAAQLFGYRTVRARPATARQAGQFFGRARAALPIGGHRLLWGNATRPVREPRSLDVRVVFYQLAAGDHLVTDHPAGVGLLAVTDLAAPASSRPQFAAAVAPYGAGWALFTPSFVETHRADGAAFVQNLTRFAVETGLTTRHRLASRYEDTDLVAVPGSLLDRAPGVGEAGASTWTRLLLPGAVPQTSVTTGGDTARIDATPRRYSEPVLLVTRREVRALSFGLGPDAGEAAQNAARALLATLRARLGLQRNLPQQAAQQIAIAAQLAPQASETLWLQGALSAAIAQDIRQSSQSRAAAYQNAAQNWDGAVRGASLAAWLVARDPVRSPAAAEAAPPALVADVPRELVELWRDAAVFSANQAAAEPPMAQVVGSPGSHVVMRFFPGDSQLPLLTPTAALLSRGASTVGWRADEQEVLLFPSRQYLSRYQVASGLYFQQAPVPRPSRGDIDGSRIYLVTRGVPISVALGSGNIVQSDPFIAGRLPDLGPAVQLARLHAYVLIDALAEDGTPVPPWMHIGLAAMVNAGVSSDLSAASRMAQSTTYSLMTGGLFSPEQFARAGIQPNTLTLAEAQALRLMVFFYNRFGAGPVAETLQRLGAGQSVDAALQATTGLTEAQFFQAWQRAEFGR